jgi:tetratricopeptide (TPR) repeat protein
MDLKRAVELDPKFALATAYLGAVTPGGEGNTLLDRAGSLAAGLPEAERTFIESMTAQRRGEFRRASELRRKLATLVPGDWRAQIVVAQSALNERHFDEALDAARKAVASNPRAAEPYNILGYAHAHRGSFDEAIAALKKYAAMRPEEPNPQDSLGEVLLMAGRYGEAEAAFLEAIRISPKFGYAWDGVALTRFLRGNYGGGREALERWKSSATRPQEKLDAMTISGLSLLAEGKHAEALSAFDAVEKEATLLQDSGAKVFTPLRRSIVYLDQKKAKEALAEVNKALERGKTEPIPGSARAFLAVIGNQERVRCNVLLQDLPEAEKALAAMEEAAKGAPGNRNIDSAVHVGKGYVALLKKDVAGAIRELSLCENDDTLCLWELSKIQEGSDKAAAAATLERIRKTSHRNVYYAYVRARIDRPAVGTKK